MTDEPFYKPRRTPDAPRQLKPGERLFEFYRERDHSRWLCELRDDGDDYGVMAQFYQNEEFITGRRFTDEWIRHARRASWRSPGLGKSGSTSRRSGDRR
jgi:hypothetical protein